MQTITVYRDVSGQWRWRLQARNGRVIADSGESYTRKGGAVRAADRMQSLNWPACKIVVKD